MKKILVTGAAGFIGFHFAKRLCEEGYDVFGLDNLNDYYDVALKKARLSELKKFKNFTFKKADLADRTVIEKLFAKWQPDVVANMAAQAGVRYSLDNPHAYVDSNLLGFVNILEGCRRNNVKHLLFASSSSVYGANRTLPFSVHHNVDHPISLYAATKKSNELMAHSYAHLYRLPCTGLRFFTVYGPWGRPDMAVYGFTRDIYAGRAINVYNHGDMMRDFTYIDDIVQAMMNLVEKPPHPDPSWTGEMPDPASSNAPYRVYNIGNNKPEKLMDMIACLEEEIGIKANKNMMEMQPGDVYATYADTDDLARDAGFRPHTPLREGLQKFVAWYRAYHA
jgi:UDP-glucuronate 4-epimerase